MSELKPFFEQVQAHYDASDAFFALFLDPSMTYSCAYFPREDMSLEEAQMAKLDLSLGKLKLIPGQRLLDIGCGWGATLCRAVQRYGVRAVGLTLSQNQARHVEGLCAALPAGAGNVRLEGWEAFDEAVDRIVSIGAFEHFRVKRYRAFFARCRSLLPQGGRMLLHSIVMPDWDVLAARGIAIRHEDIMFAKFIREHIFPGGQLASPRVIGSHAELGGFEVEHTESLQRHYARTLSIWAENLQARREQAIAIVGQQTYDIYERYLTGCSEQFRNGRIDVMQFTLVARY